MFTWFQMVSLPFLTWFLISLLGCNGHLDISNDLTKHNQLYYRKHQPYIEDEINTGKFTEMRSRRSVFLHKQNPNEKYILEGKEKPAVNKTRPYPRPRFSAMKNRKLPLDPSNYLCRDQFSNECQNKTKIYRIRVVNEFRKTVEHIVNESNYYNVMFKPIHDHTIDFQPTTCLAMKAGVRVLKRKDSPFNKNHLGKIFPKRRIFKDIPIIRSCVIVSSAGSLAGSRLGKFIDLHDIVMRFNHAPTEGYEADVGSKTTIRVVNSQVVTKAEFDFIGSKIFQNITIAAWDPGKYNGTLRDWLNNADFDLFTNYEKFRKKYPKSGAYLIDPRSVWRLWQALQSYTRIPIRRNPPSSGFIGLALLLPHCPYVDIIEYIPSTRLNGRCHYYSKEMNSACTFGAWHPLAAEKLMALEMNIADDYAVFQNGIARIRKPDKLLCDSGFLLQF